MTIEFDEKGKIFTNVIQKDPVAAVIQTTENQIKGLIHVRPGERLKDEIDLCEKFLAVTAAVICDSKGNTSQVEFLLINIQHIIWLYPEPEPLLDRGEQ